MTGWSSVDDHGQPRLRRMWRSVPDNPPVVVAGSVSIPVDWTETERDVPR